MNTFRPLWMPRRMDFTPTKLEMDSEIGPDASRTFGPSPRFDRFVVRALAIYAACFWLAIMGAAVVLWPTK